MNQPQLDNRQPPAGTAVPHLVRGGLPLAVDWCWVPGGSFTMGSRLHHSEEPVEEIQVDTFWMARCPVTNAQYRLFVEAGGYEEKRWWGEVGWQMRQRGRWTAPSYWTDNTWNEPQQPVLGVSWYEAIAFCAWAAETTGEDIYLPTEAEWEKAARGTDGRLFPWGDMEPDERRCNFGRRTGRTTAVGSYSPQGDSPYGCTDMAGNVWEWCRSQFVSYPYRPDYPRNNNDGMAMRVVRGGSWQSSEKYVHCSLRFSEAPYLRYLDVGFRCARAAF